MVGHSIAEVEHHKHYIVNQESVGTENFKGHVEARETALLWCVCCGFYYHVRPFYTPFRIKIPSIKLMPLYVRINFT